jgi:DinB superfamily
VLDRPCPECGFDAAALSGRDVAAMLPGLADRFVAVLRATDATVRPAPAIWSPTEYACHVRDVFTLFSARATAMLESEDPLFDNWDQDQTALEERYWTQNPAVVSGQLADAAARAASVFGGIPDAAWMRTGRRSNGSVFTIDSLARYFVHDVVHHLRDVNG